ncbi:uncharacterized protein LOC112519541 isoform X2 [Cynara cardunculus var. scolymus]|uniref:uncharacterized protein LOC112519541 isoform X2 n=1 Tax=Cynara cardunculus var. scolymus TaxID=59895 RepID=UPI000D625154|nr:uncharacterized protein LOC112519541 isoform X2 [Cynara cardunculus var. scolymus]
MRFKSIFPIYTFRDFLLSNYCFHLHRSYLSFISSQLVYTTCNGKMLGSSLPSGKFCRSLFSVSSVLFGHHLIIQCGAIEEDGEAKKQKMFNSSKPE